jgi:hypothetical protein
VVGANCEYIVDPVEQVGWFILLVFKDLLPVGKGVLVVVISNDILELLLYFLSIIFDYTLANIKLLETLTY